MNSVHLKTKVMKYLALFLLVLMYGDGVHGNTYAKMKEIVNSIVNNASYDPTIRPVDDQRDTLNVNISLILYGISDINEVSETVTTYGYLYTTWKDEHISWDYNNYNLSYVLLPQNKVWRPDLALKNSAKDFKPFGDESLYIVVFSTGEILWYPIQKFESTCSMSIKNFPYDEQTCTLEVMAWTYIPSEVMLMGYEGYEVDLSRYEDGPIWKLVGTSFEDSSSSSDSSKIVFYLKLQRKPQYVILSIILPIVLLAVLNICTFILPCDGGEKAGYSVTMFLAFAVFLTIVESQLPANSDSVSWFASYVIMMTTMSTVVTVIVLIENRVMSWDENEIPIPKLIIAMSDLIQCKPCCNKWKKWRHDKKNGVIEMDKDGNEIKPRQTSPEVWDGESDSSSTGYTWKRVVNSFDVLFAIICSVFVVVATMVFTLVASSGR